MLRDFMGKEKVIVYVRHGFSSGNESGELSSRLGIHPLTDKGIEQARVAGEALSKLKRVDKMAASPCERTKQTAHIIMDMIKDKFVDKSIYLDNRLIECGFGGLEGKKIEDICPKGYPIIAITEAVDKDDSSEKFEEVRERVRNFTASLRDGTLTIAVSHAYPIGVAIADALGIGKHPMLGIWIDNASFTIIRFGNGNRNGTAMEINYPTIIDEHIEFLNNTFG